MQKQLLLAVLLAVVLGLAGAAGSSLDRLTAYRGLGTWVDIYDPKAWVSPETTVAAMKAKLVRTLFLETGNYRQSVRIVRPNLVARFVEAAHAQGIRVVAWYLPSFAKPRHDLLRALAAIRFRTPTGQSFDSFALDIEASVVKSVPLRTARLIDLSTRIRAAVGSSYALGAIIPSPRGMQLLPRYWPGFPYAALADVYDVFLPMGYFSYRPRDLGGPFGYTLRNVAVIRQESGHSAMPVHAIGGLADSVSVGQARAFVRAARACGVVGAGLYDFTTTRPGVWRRLAGVPKRQAAPQPACTYGSRP
jgi:hypothetical protein